MTPSEMRGRATKTLDSAQRLLADDGDKAAYLAGEAAELALKARYCTKNSLSELPTDKGKLRKLRLNVHDLEALFRLVDGVQIDWHAMDKIDWGRVSDWHNEDRYAPVDSLAADIATERVAQTRHLLNGLAQYEVVETLAKIEREISATGVVFNLFAYVEREAGGWRLLLATRWLDDPATRHTRITELNRKVKATLPSDLYDWIQDFECFGVGDALPTAFYNFGWVGAQGYRVSDSTIISGGRLAAPVRHPGLFIATNVLVDGMRLPRSYVIALQPP